MHCVVGTEGAAFHPNLDPQPFDAVFLKGEHAAAYSGFEGKDADGTGLEAWLQAHDIDEVDICGIATDYCVRAERARPVRPASPPACSPTSSPGLLRRRRRPPSRS